MNTLDIILLVFAAIGIIYGFKTGLVKQLTLGAGITIGLLQATIFYQQGGMLINELSGWHIWICYILGFIAVFLVIAGVIILIGLLLKLLLKVVLLGWVDRIFGALFSMFIGVVILAVGVKISSSILPDNEITGQTSQKESVLYKNVAKITFTIMEEVKDEMKID